MFLGRAAIVEVVEEDRAVMEQQREGMSLEALTQAIGDVGEERRISTVFEGLDDCEPIAAAGADEIGDLSREVGFLRQLAGQPQGWPSHPCDDPPSARTLSMP